MPRLERNYEGPEVLAELLRTSGSDLTVEDVEAEFEVALEEGTEAHEIIGLFWELEPRFGGPKEARRTFANLFGLWDQMKRGSMRTMAELPIFDPTAPLDAGFVREASGMLETLSSAERRSVNDKFDNVQSDVVAFVFDRLKGLSEAAQELAMDLAFEQWWLCLRARGAVDAATRDLLEHAWARAGDEDASGEPLDEPEPALAALVTQTLWEFAAADEGPALDEAEIPAMERALTAVRWVLSVR